jgi:hypothetical protein
MTSGQFEYFIVSVYSCTMSGVVFRSFSSIIFILGQFLVNWPADINNNLSKKNSTKALEMFVGADLPLGAVSAARWQFVIAVKRK